jgi:YihY family inner membrane protein
VRPLSKFDNERTDNAERNNAEPDKPTDVPPREWRGVIKRTIREFKGDNLSDWAAALTYYGVLSIFPALLVLISLVGLAGQDTVTSLVDNLTTATPENVRDILSEAINNLQNSQGTAGVMAIVGLVLALWSASAYIAAFIRASNAIYDVPEGRPIWKTLPLRVGLTLLLMVLLAITALAVVLTGGLADRIGQALGIGSTAVTIWDIAKWPVLLLIVSFMFALLYWASPNAKQGFRWVTPGGLVAVLLWVVASAGFAFYVANFASYNKTYGSLASVIVFLVWLWISNIALLLGAELNAELERERAMASGHPEEREPYVELRDDRKLQERDAL